MKRVLLFCALAFLLCVLLAPEKKSVFSQEAITCDLPFHPEWETKSAPSAELESALAQTYRYLGSGGQCYCFVSADDKYVLKFFKQKAFSVPDWGFLKGKRIKKKESKRDRIYSAFRLAYDELREETALLYVHLNPTQILQKTIRVTDKENAEHTIDLDKTPFALQRKAELAFGYIDRQDTEGAKKAIDDLLNLHTRLYKRGYRNRDPNIRSNCGFLNGRPILFDVGRIVQDHKPLKIKTELERITPRLYRYLAQKHPDLLPHLESTVNQIAAEK